MGVSLACGLFCACALLATSGCRDIVDFDEPSGLAANVDSSEQALLPLVPERAFAQECAACASDSCDEPRAACLADPSCRELLACRSRCSNPVCIARCGAYASFGISTSFFTSGHLPGGENVRFASYEACVVEGSCREACRIGLNWACVGDSRYRWPRLAGASLKVQLEVVDAETPAGIPARVDAEDDSGFSLYGEQTGGWGQVLISPLDGGNNAFTSYFRITPKIPGLVSELYYPGTLFRPSRGTALVVMASTDVAPAAGSASAIFLIRDCLGYEATGVSFELDGLSGRPWYLEGYKLKLNNASSTNETGVGGIHDVVPVDEPVYVRATRHGEVVARASIRLRDGYLTFANLWPLSGDN